MTDINLTPSQGAGLDRYFKMNWVFSARRDLVFLIGSVLAGWAIFGMYMLLGWNMILVWLIWVIVLDTPHFFATYSRTYLDKAARKQMPRLLILSLGVFLIGPVALIVSYGLQGVGASFWKAPWYGFMIMVSLWAYWHVTRQHYGILRLYHRVNGETGTRDARIDSWVLYGCLLVPFVAFLARHGGARRRVGLEGRLTFPEREAGQSWFDYVAALQWELWVVLATVVIVVGLLGTFVVRQVQRVSRGDKIALPKLAFLAAVLPLHLYMCYSDHLLFTSLLVFTMIVTIYHDVQYLAIVWFYNENRYGGEPQKAEKTYGFAAKLSRNFWIYLGFAIVTISVPVWGLGCLIGRIKVCSIGPVWGDPLEIGGTTWIAFYVMLTLGFQMHHYVLDQFIWRPSKDKKLREDLKVEGQQPAE